MAETGLVSVSEYSLSCSICLELFVKPRTLPCQHSFCHLCILGYVEQVIRKNPASEKGFQCPCCRLFIARPDGDLDVNTWISGFPVNYTLVSIIDSVRETSTSLKTVHCGDCLREGIENNGEKAAVHCLECGNNLCQNCLKIHEMDESLSSHRLYNLHLVEQASQHEKDNLKRLGMCPQHPAAEIKYFCIDHKQYCCNECTISQHRKCDELKPIDELISMSSDELLNEVHGMADAVTDGCSVLLNVQKCRTSTLEETSEKAKSNISDLVQLMNDYVAAFEHRTVEQIDEAEKATLSEITEKTDEVNTLKEMAAQSMEFMETARRHGNKLQSYFATLKMKEDLEKVENDVRKSFREIRIEEMDIPGLADFTADMFKLRNIVNIEMKASDNEVPKYPGLKPFHVRKPVLKAELCVDNHGNIDGCDWVTSDVILVAERDKKRISLIDINTHVATDRKTFPTMPWQVTKIDQSTFAASFPGEKKVRIVSVDATSIVPVSCIDTQGTCHGLAYSRTREVLMILLRDQGKIAQYRLNGSLVDHIPVNGTTKTDIKNAYCMGYNEDLGHIYISCHNTQKVVAIDLQGTQVFVYMAENCKGPWGVSSDSDHNVYVCWFGSSAVHQIDKTGVFIREIVGARDKINCPLILSINDAEDAFILTASENGKNIRHYRYV